MGGLDLLTMGILKTPTRKNVGFIIKRMIGIEELGTLGITLFTSNDN